MSVIAISTVPIEKITVRVFSIPTDAPESDGTLKWDSTTMVLAEVFAGGHWGIGYSYTHRSAANIIHDVLFPCINGVSVMDIPACWGRMLNSIRNFGDTGLCMTAVSVVDSALWDLKSKLLNEPLASLLGVYSPQAEIYGSGGFTSYSLEKLSDQLYGWASMGIKKVKMKVGRRPQDDPKRVKTAKKTIGDNVELFVDANGGYSRKQALAMADTFAESEVRWFEEPVYHRDTAGLKLIRDRAPAIMDIAVGEYGFDIAYFRDLLVSEAVDVVQADVTRCGITGFLAVGAMCRAHYLGLSSHCAPSIHLHPACSLEQFRHMEYFHDHVRIENMLFDGVALPSNGILKPDLSRPGTGLELKESDVAKFEIARQDGQ